jgi:hypothetical protein
LPVTIPGGGLSVADPNAASPRDFVLEQNYPNPVYGETLISYSLPRTAALRLTFFNMLGQQVQVLVNGLVPAGKHVAAWNGLDQHGQRVAKGVYFYRLETENFTTTKKLIIMR